MISAAPTILALETDSAWVVVLAVSLVTLPATLLLRRLIARPGGIASGLLLSLPLLLPVVAAVAYNHAVLPEIAVLKPVGAALLDRPGSLLHVLLVSDGHTDVVTPYAFSGSAGPWLLLIGVSVSSFMLLRRAFGVVMVRRLVGRCRPLATSACDAEGSRQTEKLCHIAGLNRIPEVRILPAGVQGAFVVGARHGTILLSEDLLAYLDEHELQAILAHEIAHLEARDVPVVFGAGLLRDMLAWNPLSHIAFRRLLTDRELEADRRAAAMTGRPLELASGLLKMCELVGAKRKLTTGRSALAFLRPGGRVSRRVANLLALADGRVALSPAGRVPYVAAAALVAFLGLQAGARLAAQDPTALAIVVGTTSAPQPGLWAPKATRAHAEAFRSGEPHKVAAKRRPGQLDLSRTLRYPELLDGSVKTKDLPKWMDAVSKLAARLNISPTTLRWQARAVSIFDQPTVGPISIFRMESQLHY
ncbi:hypothetical protein BH24ACT26_BH24ACT26_18820 [soil metagenome]